LAGQQAVPPAQFGHYQASFFPQVWVAVLTAGASDREVTFLEMLIDALIFAGDGTLDIG
jgi:hypothetical protein